MATTREQLIADWHRRLAEAEDIPGEQSSRPAWMTRLRLRLYRFLISLYGEGGWSAGETAADHELSSPPDVVVADQALPLAGKPAKDESSIRAALQSFAAGREEPTAAGPLILGTDHTTWVVVASTNWGLDPQRSSDTLRAKGINSRLVCRAEETTVEVLALHRATAMALIASQLGRLTLPPHKNPAISPTTQRQLSEATALAGGYLILGLAIAPLLGVTVVAITQMFWPEILDSPTPTTLFALFGITWISSSLLMCLAYLLVGTYRLAAAAKSQPRK